MWVSKAAGSLNKIVRPVSKVLLGAGLGILALMMCFTGADVALRYVFNRPVAGSMELIEYMMAIIVAFGLAYCAVMKGHVRVDFVISRFPKRIQIIISSITGLLSFGLFSVATWQLCLYTKELFDSGQSSVVLLIPTFPFVALVAVGSAILSLVLLADFLDLLSQALRS